jgi:hypothetical protein
MPRTFSAHKSNFPVENVEALAAVTGIADLADAFAWFRSMYQADTAQERLQQIRDRSTSVHGINLQPDSSVLATSRALNNKVAYMISNRVLQLKFDVRSAKPSVPRRQDGTSLPPGVSQILDYRRPSGRR